LLLDLDPDYKSADSAQYLGRIVGNKFIFGQNLNVCREGGGEWPPSAGPIILPMADIISID
jgi:hypothetical protein